MMDNMELYNAFREVPENAKKSIRGGRLKGMTDINPMWRIQALTEQFGPCGIGWRYEITNKILQPGASGEIAAFVDIMLYYVDKDTGEISFGIPGTGGSMFVTKEKNGMYTSDECFKMALTDAISVAAKSLGVGADVYWQAGRTKYNNPEPAEQTALPKCEQCGSDIIATFSKKGQLLSPNFLADYSRKKFGRCLCSDCMKHAEQQDESAG